jgi:4-hydroxythreonine-4-phosphate dehydrogenase
MKINKILIILGEPQSTFSEILFKYFNSKEFSKNKKKIILIGSINLMRKQMKKLKFNLNLNAIENIKEAKINELNILNINYNSQKIFSKISSNSKKYISNCFKTALNLIKNNKKIALINGPISKKYFLNKKYLGITEYISKKTKSKNQVMIIYNDKLSVSPLTTHLPLKHVAKKISKEKIIKNVKQINKFYENLLNKNPKIAILGLNPHCETIDKVSEEKNVIIPAINFLKKINLNTDGPFPADTFFLKKNINKYDVVVGMYHDQVITPLKTLYNFNAINITLGLPFIRISPDHGPNNKMLGKNKSDPSSIFCAMRFINKIR